MHRQLSRHEGALPVRSPSARVLLLALDPTPTSSRGQSRHGPYNAGLLPGLRMLATVKGDAADDEVQDGTTSIPDVAHAPRRRAPDHIVNVPYGSQIHALLHPPDQRQSEPSDCLIPFAVSRGGGPEALCQW